MMPDDLAPLRALLEAALEIRGALERVENLSARYDKLLASEHALSDAYVRLRKLIPGAFDTPHAPDGPAVWSTTEAALGRQMARIARLEAALRDTKDHDASDGRPCWCSWLATVPHGETCLRTRAALEGRDG